MTKEWRERLAAYDEAGLEPRERAALELLLDSDPEARAYLADLREDRQRYREALGAITARPGFNAAVMARVSAHQGAWYRRLALNLRPRALEMFAVGMMALVAFAMIPRDVAARQQTVCKTNLKDLGRSLAAYSQDWDDHLPEANTWAVATAAYQERSNGLICPVDDRVQEDSHIVSYGMPQRVSGQNLGRVRDLATEVALRDAEGSFLAPRHDRRANAAYLDGHVAPLSFDPPIPGR